jgi:hypothetical protein
VSDPQKILRDENKRRKQAKALLQLQQQGEELLQQSHSLIQQGPCSTVSQVQTPTIPVQTIAVQQNPFISRPVPAAVMAAPWEFPPLKKVETIKTFNGDADKLDDFTTSVEAYIFSRDLPLKYGGWVTQNDEEWIYCALPATDAAAAAARMRKNYKYSKKFCVMLAERFTDAAREWWITTGRNMDINCWHPAKPGRCPPDVVETPFFHVLQQQFQNARSQESALLALETLRWKISDENTASFRTRVNSLFTKAGINEYNAKRAFILGVLDEDMRRQIMRPTTEQDLWLKIEEVVATEESIRATKDKKKGKEIGGDNKDKKDMKELTCYTCQKKGHISPNCPENKDKKDKDSRSKKKDTKSGRSDGDVCYNCGGKGHRSPECPSRSFGKKKDGKSSEKVTSNLHLDTRDQSPQYYYQSQQSSSTGRTNSKSDDLGSYYYPMESNPGTDFYSFDTLPWYDETSDDHWRREEAESHMLVQYHYDDVKYGSVALPMQSDTTEFYTHEIETDKDTLPNFAINQTNLPDSPISFGDMYDAMGQVLSGQIVSPPKGSMRTYTYTLDNKRMLTGKRMLTVGDTGTAVNVIPRSVLQPTGFKITRPPDQKFLTTDGITISPVGICDEFIFRLGGIQFTIKTYVCERAGFQLLLGTHFWWSVGAALFPRLEKNHYYETGITRGSRDLRCPASGESSATVGTATTGDSSKSNTNRKCRNRSHL